MSDQQFSDELETDDELDDEWDADDGDWDEDEDGWTANPYYEDDEYADDALDWDEDDADEWEDGDYEPEMLWHMPPWVRLIERLRWELWRFREFTWFTFKMEHKLYRCCWCKRIERFGHSKACLNNPDRVF